MERQFGDCAFSVNAPCACNQLPTELKLVRLSTATLASAKDIVVQLSVHLSLTVECTIGPTVESALQTLPLLLL